MSDSKVQPILGRAIRQRLRAQGLRPVELWLPAVDSPEFAAEAHRQSLVIASSAQAGLDQDFVEAMAAEDER